MDESRGRVLEQSSRNFRVRVGFQDGGRGWVSGRGSGLGYEVGVGFQDGRRGQISRLRSESGLRRLGSSLETGVRVGF